MLTKHMDFSFKTIFKGCLLILFLCSTNKQQKYISENDSDDEKKNLFFFVKKILKNRSIKVDIGLDFAKHFGKYCFL